MFRSLTGTIGAVLLGGAALLAQPQEQGPTKPPAVQPASQQSVQEQECYNWAKSHTGIDPQAPAAAATQPEQRAIFKKAVGTCLQGRAATG
ncbi:MAG TPA: hypothetical protein VJ303_00090 [Steroidobacteraceae bacterium]|jgi:hypothetical protein|nr:hypothetical protein [Steroidobacteraceae bacterium]